MKNLLPYLCAALILNMLLLPLISVKGEEPVKKPENTVQTAAPLKVQPGFKVKNTETGEISEYSAADYVFGVVAGEMPAAYESEALKAQAVAAYTYALYKKDVNKNEDYDITNNSSLDQVFITRQKARSNWGDNADKYETKIDEAVKAVQNQIITYNGAPIMAVYHAISAGKTESAENVWGKAIPYLVPAESIGDLLAGNYLSEVSFTPEEFKQKTAEKLTLSGNAEKYITDIKRSESGTVLTLKICGTGISGKELKGLLGLKSANFDVTYKSGKLTFTVRGFGHGVGMSQYGANYMAKQGSSYTDILAHYYKGCSLKTING